MKSALAALGLLALVPVSASAESAYAACMRMGQLPGDSASLYLSRNAGYYNGTYYGGGFGPLSGSSYYDRSYGSYAGSGFGGWFPGRSFAASNAWSFSQNTRVLNKSRACRHLVNVKPPAYRVVGLKSPAQRTSTNLTGRKVAPKVSPGFLAPGN